jgi:acyl-CoA thioesterase II
MTATPFWASLRLEQRDGDRYEAPPRIGGLPRTFGGQVAAQALRAATLTVDGPRRVHSLHAYFIRPGRPGQALRFEVTRTRDGRSFSTRTVTASQEGKPVFEMIASFHDPEPGEDWQGAAPSVPAPDDLPPVRIPLLFGADQPVEIRPVNPPEPSVFPLSHPFWARVTAPVGDDPALHACLLTYLSDLAVVRSARSPASAAPFEGGVSLDHTIWFHRPSRADEWLLYSMGPVAHVGTRGLAQGSVHTHGGALVASLAQEALLRPPGGRI